MLNVLIYSVLCGTGSVAFASFAGNRQCSVTLTCGWLAAMSFIVVNWVADPVWVGIATGIIAVCLLVRPCHHMAAACSGCLAGVWGADLVARGVPPPAALVTAVLPLMSAWAATKRSDFAPRALREEALLVVLVLSLVVASAPVVGAGWRSAAGLRGDANAGAVSTLQWPFWVVVGAFGLGSVFSIRRTR